MLRIDGVMPVRLSPIALRDALLEHRDRGTLFKRDVLDRTADVRGHLLSRIGAIRRSMLDEAFSPASAVAATSPELTSIVRASQLYATQSEWNLIDPVLLLACVPNLSDETVVCTARASLVHHAFRMVDDVIDQHHTYKGGYRTLYGNLLDASYSPGDASALTLLAALALVCEGTRGLPDDLVNAAEATIMGAAHEIVRHQPTSLTEYRAIVEGKMVRYGLLLYGPALRAIPSPARDGVEHFLRHSFVVAQLVNDLLDRHADRQRSQANFWDIMPNEHDASISFLEEIGSLEAQALAVSAPYDAYARVRTTDIVAYSVHALDHGGGT